VNDARVSRETLAPAPAAATAVAGERLPLLTRYADLLATDGVTRGLIGPREVSRLWERHLLNCAVVADSAVDGETVADVGSGAGLPGVVWAICRPGLAVTLIEPLLRRTTFLTEVVAELGLDNVEVLRARAEELHGKVRYDVVTSRAVAPLDRLGGWCLPLVAVGGRMVAMKGAGAGAEAAAAQGRLQRLGGGPATVVEYGRGLVEPTTWAVQVQRLHDVTRPGSPAGSGSRGGRAGRGRSLR